MNTKGAKFRLKNGDPLGELRFTGASERAIGAGGELNANDTKDLMRQIDNLQRQVQSGNITRDSTTAADARKARQARNEIFAAARNDDNKWKDIGIVMAAEIQEAATREGFLRNVVIEETLGQGQRPIIRVRYPNVLGAIAVSPAETRTQIIRDKYFYPSEFNITANLEIEEREIAQATGDILDEKYREGLQAVMVQEDRMWKRGADESVGQYNPLTVISGGLTPNYLMSIANLVQGWNLATTTCLLSYDFWPDIATNANWVSVFDPVSQAEILLTGRLGQIYGLSVRTDGFRPPEQKVLNQGELYVVSDPQFHGAITTRGGVEPTPLLGPTQGRTTKGWFLSELISFMIVNFRSVAKGQRG